MIVTIPGLGTIETTRIRRVTDIQKGEWIQATVQNRGVQDRWFEVTLADVREAVRVTTFDHVFNKPTGLQETDVITSRELLVAAWGQHFVAEAAPAP